MLPPFVDDCAGNSASETVITPKKKKTTVKPCIVRKAIKPPLIMSIKSYFPLSLAYACLGDHRDTFFRIVNPFRCMTYHFVTVLSKPQS